MLRLGSVAGIPLVPPSQPTHAPTCAAMTGRSAVTRPPGESSQPSSPRRTGSRLAMATTVMFLLTCPTLTGQTTTGPACPKRAGHALRGQGEAEAPAGAGDVVGEGGGLVPAGEGGDGGGAARAAGRR